MTDGMVDGMTDGFTADALDGAVVGGCPDINVVSHVAPEPGNGPDRLAAMDTDDNGISDVDEWGPTVESPLDFDLDGTDDFRDLDDDGDGLLDRHDTMRLLPAQATDWSAADRVWLYSSQVDAVDAATNTARVGETLIIEGEGFDCSAVVAFLGGSTPINLAPQSVNGDALAVVVPAGAQGPLAVYMGQEHSNQLPVHIAADTDPVLSIVRETARPSSAFVLRGSGLAEVTAVELHGTMLTPTSVSETEVTVQVPASLAGLNSDVVALAGEARSNRLAVILVRSVRATVAGDATGLDVVTPTSRVAAAGGAEVDVRTRGVALVSAARGEATMLEAIVLPSDEAVELSETSSAVSAAFLGTRAPRVIAAESLELLRTRIAALAEVDALAAEIGSRDFDGLGAQLVAAVNAAQMLIDDGLADGSLMPFETVALPAVAAVIDPVEQSGVTVSQIPDTGNIRVSNDTALYASTRIDDIELDRILVPHVPGPFHPRVVQPQSPAFGIAFDMDYPAPNSRDARVEVLTSGAAAPLPTRAIDRRAHTLLALRTVIGEAIAPAMDVMLGIDVEPSIVAQAFIRHSPAEVIQFGEQVRAGNVEEATASLVDIVLNQARVLVDTGVGGDIIVDILEDKFNGWLQDKAIDFASRFVPIVGQVKSLYDLFDTLATTGQFVRAAVDIATTPALLEYQVTFGMVIEALEPDELERGCTGGFLTVVGAGLDPENDGSLPVVTVTDPHPLGAAELTVSSGHWRIAADGTEIEIELPDSFTTTMQGPLGVSVTHRGETSRAPDSIAVIGDPQLSEVMPGVAAEDDPISVVGTGLDDVVAVRFVDPADPSMRVEVTAFTSRSPTQLDLIVPTLPSTSRTWLVQAVEGSAACEVTSNTVGIATSAGACITAIGGIPFAINNAGTIAGRLTTGECFLLEPRDGEYFVDDDGDMTNDLMQLFSVPDMTCQGVGISEDGTFIGELRPLVGSLVQAFVGDTTGIRPIGTPGDGTTLKAINATGEMVGSAYFMDGTEVAIAAARITESGVTPLHAPDSTMSSAAYAISDAGTAAGSHCCPGRAELWPGGALPGANGVATALNDSGQVVGYTSPERPTLWEGGVRTELASFESGSGRATDINASGQIVGYSADSREACGVCVPWPEGALWLPVPAYGYPAGLVDLPQIARDKGWSRPIIGRAQAINDVGQIVGGGEFGWIMDMTACAP